jgi:hypothetical protein
MFEDTQWDELKGPFPAGTGLLEEDGVAEGAPAREPDDPDAGGEADQLDEMAGALGTRADARRKGEEDEDFEEDDLEDEEEFEDDEDLDDDFDDDFEEEEDLEEDLDEEPGEEEDL